MRIAGIFRGFPGLGRVVSGTEILSSLKHQGAEVKLFTYMQGSEYVESLGYSTSYDVRNTDISSIGIIPVSNYGEIILNQLRDFNPEFVLIDGEPLMLTSLKISLPNIKIVALLNPYDVVNPHNQWSSNLFFQHAYSMSDLAIVHGLYKVEKPKNYNAFLSINTIIRQQVLEMKKRSTIDKVSCILGGGSVHVTPDFQDATVRIADMCINLAHNLISYEHHIYCGDRATYEKVSILNWPNNMILHDSIANCETYFLDSKLIIARAGRNVASELLYLGIPAILVPTNASHRSDEQRSNAAILQRLSEDRISSLEIGSSEHYFAEMANRLVSLSDVERISWCPGNDEAISSILALLDRK